MLKGSITRNPAGAVPGAEGLDSRRIEALSPLSNSSWLPGGVSAMAIHVQFSSPALGKGDIGSRLGGYQAAAAMRNWATERFGGPIV